MKDRWHHRAACRDSEAEVFFSDSSDKGINLKREAVAKSICNKCPVAAECLFDAISRKENYGVWGSFAPKERRTIANLFKDSIDVELCKKLVNKEIKSIKAGILMKELSNYG